MYNIEHYEEVLKMGGIDLSGIFSGQTGMMILYFAVIIVVFYFLLIRPQKKKEKAHANLLSSIKKGDQIVTIGGFRGKVLSVKENIITIQLGDNKVKIENWAVKDIEKPSKESAPEIEAEDTEDEDTQTEA